jgi:hypothetical protein
VEGSSGLYFFHNNQFIKTPITTRRQFPLLVASSLTTMLTSRWPPTFQKKKVQKTHRTVPVPGPGRPGVVPPGTGPHRGFSGGGTGHRTTPGVFQGGGVPAPDHTGDFFGKKNTRSDRTG